MNQHSLIKVKDSIATKLLTTVFSIYLGLTITVTVTHMVAEYFHTKDVVVDELKTIERTFEPGLASAIWDMHLLQLKSTFLGMVEFPSVVGLKINDEKGREIGAVGTIINHENKVLSITPEGKRFVGDSLSGLFWHTFPIIYTLENKNIAVGEATIYSSSAVVFKRVQLGFLFIIINAIIKTVALWWLFLIVSRRLLSRPLASLSTAIRQINWDNKLDEIKISIKTKGRNELKILEEAFNSMILKLSDAKQEIYDKANQLNIQNQELSTLSENLTFSNKRLTTLLDNSKAFALVQDKLEAMIQASHTILQEIPVSRSAKALIAYHDIDSQFFEGYTALNSSLGLSQIEAFIKRNNHTSKLETIFTPRLPDSFSYHADIAKETGSFLKENQLNVLAYREGKLLGVIQIHNVDQQAFTQEHKEFVDTLSQLLSLTLEEIEMTIGLESKVKERTRELSETIQQLNNQHSKLQQAQTQLVQSEKLASLGTLVAGVAHEINNPVNFIHNGSQNVETHLKELRSYVFEIAGEDASEPMKQSFENRFNGLFKFLQTIISGSVRIKSIVADLRMFSRLEEAEKKTTRIVEGIGSTIRLVKTEYKQAVEFITDFQANPELECWPAQLNQVFMNILVNGCQSIRSKQQLMNDESQGTITIRTLTTDNQLEIEIHDTGCGMPKEVLNRLFEPFFTTKPVGEGTGLGMSVTYGIIEKHQGKISVESQEGKGTTVTLLLPL